MNYFREAWEELKRVSWPSRDEVVQGTSTVLLFLGIMTLILWAMDTVFQLGLTNGLFRLASGG
ncbi:MAG: preprotein translocase subunit SecE [Deinococcales bacterium]